MKYLIYIFLLIGQAIALNFDSSEDDEVENTEIQKESNPVANRLPFPSWLSDFTGLTEWPGMDPPYIPLDFIDVNSIPDGIPRHGNGHCEPVINDHETCSFDCYNCVSADDVYTCPKLSQTFDDGPSLMTLKLLDKLKSKSTFFTLGVNIVLFPDIYRKTLQMGHIMGSHTWSHKFLPSLTNEQIIAQIEWSIWAMNATCGHLPKWFRPPYGGLDNRVRSIVRQFGMQNVVWDFDTFDWKLISEDDKSNQHELEIYEDIERFKKTKGSQGLILEHDVYPRTVEVAIEVHKLIGPDQITVPECVGGIDYIKKFIHI